MGYFYAFGTDTPAAPGATAIPACTVTIPVGHRAMVRRVDAFALDATGTTFYVYAGGVPVWAGAIPGIGALGADTFIYVDALAAAVVLLGYQDQVTASTLGGMAISGIYQ